MNMHMHKRVSIALAIAIAATPIAVVPDAHAGTTKTCDSALSCNSLKGQCAAANGVYGGYSQGATQWGICWFPIAAALG